MTEDSDALALDFWRLLADPEQARGALRWKLDDHQLRIYDPFRAWETRRMAEMEAGRTEGIHRVFMVDCGRQVGKTFSTSLIRMEDAHVFPNQTQLIASATEKQLKELIIPVLNTIIADAPNEVRPRFFSSRWGMRAGYHCPASDSIIKLVGVDVDPDGLRGPGLGGANFTEAAFIDKLSYAVSSIVYPQFSRRPFATCILESSAPADLMHDFDQVFRPDCERRKAYVFMTLWDNTALTEETKRELYDSAAAINEDDAKREYLGERRRDRTRMVVPEFDADRHVVAFERPSHALAIAAFDPGMSDLFAMCWGYWDAQRAKLCIEQCWSGRNVSTAFVAEVIREIERDLYGEAAEINRPRRIVGTPREELRRLLRVLSGEEEPDLGSGFGIRPPAGLSYWNGREFRPNPVMRVSDTDSRLIGDLNEDHAIPCVPTSKDDKEAAIYALRNAFKADKIEVHPRCTQLIQHVQYARWNDRRTDWERHTEGQQAVLFGHYDLLATAIYIWRMVQGLRHVDPFPPRHYDRADPAMVHVPDDWAAHEPSVEDWLQ